MNIIVVKIFTVLSFFVSLLDATSKINTFDGGGGTLDFVLGSQFFEIIDPKEISFTYKIRQAKDFGASFNSSFHGFGVRLVPIEPYHGCAKPTNIDEIEGSVALIERGECSFISKTIIAEEYGAIAVVIADNDIKGDGNIIEMINDGTGRNPKIPAGFLIGKNGYVIRETLKKLNRDYALINIPVNLTYVDVNKMNQPKWVLW